jgi:hypothetical protein
MRNSRVTILAALAVLFSSVAILPERCDGFVLSSSRHLDVERVLTTTSVRISRNGNQNNFDLPSSFFFQDDDRSNLDSSNPLNFESSAALNEYDRDAEFYRRRNLEYYNSLQQMQQHDEYSFNELTASRNKKQSISPLQNEQTQKLAEDTISSVLKNSQASFKNVEQITFRLLQTRPFVALGIFLAAGALVAYLTGFFILDGYIDNLNPAENDAVPYWNEPEIHTIMRRP